MNELDAIKARREAISHMVRDTTTRRATAYDAQATAAFIAAAPADVDTLLREVERLTGERDALNMWCDEWKRRADELTAELAAERDAAKRHATYIASCVDECGSYRP